MSNESNIEVVVPSMGKGFIDKIAFILPTPSEKYSREKWLEKVVPRMEKLLVDRVCERVSGTRRYRLSVEFRSPGGAKVFLQFIATRPGHQKGDLRIELNPSHFTKADAAAFHEFMRKILGRGYDRLLLKALINRLDLAVDIKHLRLSNLIVNYSRTRKCTLFGKTVGRSGLVEGYHFGSISSDHAGILYDKTSERLTSYIEAIAGKGLDLDSLKENVVRQLTRLKSEPPVVRVEIRNMKLNGKTLHEVWKETNRFCRFSFQLMDGAPDLPARSRLAFQSVCRDVGVTAALEIFKGSPSERALRGFVTTRPKWWVPDDLWHQALLSLRRSGILPPAAFEGCHSATS